MEFWFGGEFYSYRYCFFISIFGFIRWHKLINYLIEFHKDQFGDIFYVPLISLGATNNLTQTYRALSFCFSKNDFGDPNVKIPKSNFMRYFIFEAIAALSMMTMLLPILTFY